VAADPSVSAVPDAEPASHRGTRFKPEQEVRLAVVMYGGVSLAIYMYGVAEELYHLVRATAPDRPYDADDERPEALAFAEPSTTEAVYRELGKLLPLEGGSLAPDAPVRTRFVVDIISGTSAGGINGVCLAKALANETSLEVLRDVWLDEGDIGSLVNDEESIRMRDEEGKLGEPIPDLVYEPPPRSLLNGRRMLLRLVKAMDELNPAAGANATESRLVDELDLWVTATDLDGLELPIQLANATAVERRYANRYHFRYSAAEGRNDFGADDSGFLAYAARSTSAFPFAFEPVMLGGLEPFAAVREDWRRFYPDYARATPEFATRAFSDGGILDNKPFSYATETLVRRHASLPVDRKLLYVEPAPEEEREARENWNAIDTAQAALLGIPRKETIRGDIQTVLARNRRIERVRDIVSRVGTDAEERGKLEALAEELPDARWGAQTLSKTIAARNWGPSYGTYHRLKVRGLVDYLAGVVARAAGLDPASDDAFAVHYLMRAWKEAHYAEEGGDGRATENEFLIEFDLPYRARRLSFVLQKLKELQSDDAEDVGRVLAGCDVAVERLPDDPEAGRVFEEFRRGLSETRRRLYSMVRELGAPDGQFAAAVRELAVGREELRPILDARTDEAMRERANALLRSAGRTEAFASVVDIARERFAAMSAQTRQATEGLLRGHTSTRRPSEAADLRSTLRYTLRFYYDAFEAYDLVFYPIESAGLLGETNPVEVVRISPLDAEGPAGVSPAARVLKGRGVHHFGAFLDRGWRRHDMVWGRLNAAECLIRTLLPENHPQAGPLIEQAHRTIIDEYRRESDPATTPEKSLAWFNEEYAPGAYPKKEPTIAALNRSAAVIWTLVDSMLQDRDGRSRTATRALWSTALQLLPPRPGGFRGLLAFLSAAVRHPKVGAVFWLVLLALLLMVGAAFGSPYAKWVVLGSVAVITVGIVAAAWVAISRVRRFVLERANALVFPPRRDEGDSGKPA
jgi:patatin-related protein